MEELMANLDAIKNEMEELDKITKLMERQNSVLGFLDKVHKEVI